MNHNANAQSYGSPKGRASYTAQEEAELREYLIQKRREGMPLYGNVIYRTYPGVDVRHPWQSIRSHAIKFIMPNLPPERSVVVNMANERMSASTTPIVNEQEQIHNATLTQITNNQEQQENNADNTSSPNATPTRIEICEFQGQDNAPTSSTPQLSDKRELQEPSVSNVISIQSVPGNDTSIQSESGSVTLIQSEPSSVYCTPLKQIRSSSDLQEERSSNVTQTRPMYNNYRESQEQTIFTKDEVKTFRDYLISQRNAGEGLYGSLIYRLYPGLHEHSWNYLREYAINHIIPKLPDDSNNDRRQSQTSKITHDMPNANSRDDIYEVVGDDEFDPKNGSSSVHDIINMDQFQDDESSDFFDDNSDAQTLVSCATIVEDDSPSPERTRCHFLSNHDADDYYHDGSVKRSRTNKGKKAVSFHISRSDQATDNTSTSPSNSTILLQSNDSNGESLEKERITTPPSQSPQAVLQKNKQLSTGNIFASSSKSVSSVLHVEIEDVDSAFSEAMEQLCESPTINHLNRQYLKGSTLNIATPQNHLPIRTFNQVPSSKALGKRPAPSISTPDNCADNYINKWKKRKPSSIKNFDSSDLEKISNSKHGTQLLAEQEFFINLTSIAAEFLVDRKEVMQIVHMTGCNLQMVREYFQNGRNIPDDKKKYFWTNDEDMALLKPNNFQSISTIKTNHGTKLFWERSEYINRYYARDAYL
ncbi:11720_t:CDS:2 [Ambispora leptoticha]|uniref:Telomeric repeat-binding factor 2-interacting protein 1 n=1 Tax=Ambispora leptoticha TaxID=144679 RepID=A0A9N8ZXI2_9GLOM|nr:11720_t:CDS:2 [Ambispora leptoticha]